MKSIFTELRNRGVVRSVSYYLGISWLAIGAGDILFPIVGINESLLKTLIIVLAAGSPIVVIAAWFFPFDDVPTNDSSVGAKKSGTDLLVVAVLAAVFTVSAIFIYLDEEPILAPEPEMVKARPAREGTHVAVLEIRNRSNHESGEWLAGGVSEELRRQMNTWDQITVLPAALTRSRTAEDLSQDVDYIIEGYLIDENDGVTVKVDIVDLTPGKASIPLSATALWSEPKQLQISLASNIATTFDAAVILDSALTPEAGAWPEYLRYIGQSNFGDIEHSIFWLEKVLEKDPTWTVGRAIMTLNLLQQYNHVGDAGYRDRAAAAIGTAAKDPNQGVWIWAWGLLQSYGYQQIEQGIPIFAAYADQSGITAQFYPQLAMAAGLNEEVREPIRRLTQAQPYLPNLFQIKAMNETVLGNHSAARVAAERMVQLSAQSAYQAHQIAGIQAAVAGDFERADEFLTAMKGMHESRKDGSFSKLSSKLLMAHTVAALGATRGEVSLVEQSIGVALAEHRYTQALIYHLLIGQEEEAKALLPKAKGEEKLTWGWWVYRALMPPAVRTHPLILELELHLGLTPELRLAICKDMAERPAHLGYQCDPEKYASPNQRPQA